MNRQQRRASERKTMPSKASKEQIARVVEKTANEKLKNAYHKGLEKGVNEALVLLLTLPLEVLMDYYWKKSYAEKIPKFTNYVLEYYKKWQNGEIDMEKLKQDLWEYGGVRLEVEDGED